MPTGGVPPTRYVPPTGGVPPTPSQPSRRRISNLTERQNGPVCIILLMVLLVSGATLTGGIVKYIKEGKNDNTIILILFGAIVFLFVILGFIITLCTEPPPPRQRRTASYSDGPPEYRETWRRQHLESCCSKDTDIYNLSVETNGTTMTNFSRLDVRSLQWMSADVPGVHEPPMRTTSFIAISEGEEPETDVRPTRAYTEPPLSFKDEDPPPSYEVAEALKSNGFNP